MARARSDLALEMIEPSRLNKDINEREEWSPTMLEEWSDWIANSEKENRKPIEWLVARFPLLKVVRVFQHFTDARSRTHRQFILPYLHQLADIVHYQRRKVFPKKSQVSRQDAIFLIDEMLKTYGSSMEQSIRENLGEPPALGDPSLKMDLSVTFSVGTPEYTGQHTFLTIDEGDLIEQLHPDNLSEPILRRWKTIITNSIEATDPPLKITNVYSPLAVALLYSKFLNSRIPDLISFILPHAIAFSSEWDTLMQNPAWSTNKYYREQCIRVQNNNNFMIELLSDPS